MKKLISLIVMVIFSTSVLASINTEKALKTFKQELQAIKSKLETGKMSAAQASILLAAIQVRQNNVIIAQNSELLARGKYESK